jgi:hypothetical protein
VPSGATPASWARAPLDVELLGGGDVLDSQQEHDAADIIHALASPGVYGLLVFDRGWSGERYEKWLRSILTGQLLPS